MTTSRWRRGWRLILLILLALVVLFVAATVISSRWSTRPQGEPQAVEFATAELSAPLLDARILALGEATHGNAEFQDLRLTLSQKMLPRGTRTIVLEEDYGTTTLINDFIQGGEGTAEEAALRFGFRINQTAENARWLSWLREYNSSLPDAGKVQLTGMDVQRTVPAKTVALEGLALHDPDTAQRLETELADLDEETGSGGAPVPEHLFTATDKLVEATSALPDTDPDTRATHLAARALRHNVELISSGADYGEIREAAMFDMLTRLSEESPTPVLLFGHNGHVARTTQGAVPRPVGARAAEEWGEGYRVIGTDFIDTVFLSGTGDDRRTWTLHNRSPLRGIYRDTHVGYLDFSAASEVNREVLDKQITMGSAGERFTRLQQFIPLFHLVAGVPTEWYDALIMVDAATPTTMLQ